ncbi:hypothetical protein CDAR_59121 [Caerostris darwini]|uniref:Uncharacterized protein n=1 Tax=Caerostris darwini TaxID=1538125 RepID=A0AAV4X5Y6_9ARAC|nr:hypothetical protein CDAR_59121 [Caerostris darwini]
MICRNPVKLVFAAEEEKNMAHREKVRSHFYGYIYYPFRPTWMRGVEVGVQEKRVERPHTSFITWRLVEMKSPKTNFVVLEAVKRPVFLASEFLHDTVHQAERFRRTRPFLIGTTRSEEEWFSTRITTKKCDSGS